MTIVKIRKREEKEKTNPYHCQTIYHINKDEEYRWKTMNISPFLHFFRIIEDRKKHLSM